jgi:hypothetical protein
MMSEEIEVEDVYDCMNLGGEWQNGDVSFDNILISFMSQFELLTAKFWWTLVIGVSDKSNVDKEPKEFTNPASSLFIVILTIIGFLFIRAVITGLINFAFIKQKEEIQGVTHLDYAQRRWVNFSKVIFKASPIKEVYNIHNLLV